MNKSIINQDSHGLDVSFKMLCVFIMRYMKQTVQTKASKFLIKKTSPTSTQEHDPDMYCTVSLSKR
jgi:hypothetical protein